MCQQRRAPVGEGVAEWPFLALDARGQIESVANGWRSEDLRFAPVAAKARRISGGIPTIVGLDGISKSQVSRLCEELDTEVERFRTRKLDGNYPYKGLTPRFSK